MKIIHTIIDLLTNNNNNNQTNQSTNKEPPKKTLIYDKIIPLINTNTEGRQKIIKKLLKEDSIPLNEDIYLEPLCVECGIKEPEFESKTKILEVYVTLDYDYTMGYIHKDYIELLDERLHNNTCYSTILYASKDDKKYNLDVGIQIYQN